MENLDIKNHFVVVDRSRWLRGVGGAVSYLQRASDGKRCCLGFACLQVGGRSENDIVGCKAPSSLHGPIGPWGFSDSAMITSDGDSLLYLAMQVNDTLIGSYPFVIQEPDESLSKNLIKGTALDVLGMITDEADREARLVKIFNAAGLEIEFVDGPVVEGGAP